MKPENILVSDAAAKIADFGLAKVLENDADHAEKETERNSDGQRAGMPYRYRTPELVQYVRRESLEITSASDIYQMGTVFYELLTGSNPQAKPDRISEDIRLDLRDIKGSKGGEITG